MSGAFDGYHVWLGIPPNEQPPNHYRLLGISVYEADLDVIDHAADRQMAHVRTFQSGKHGALSQQILNELAAARLCLLSADKKSTYDDELRVKLAPAAAVPVLPVAAAVPLTAVPMAVVPVAAAMPVAKALPVAQAVTPVVPKAVPIETQQPAMAPVAIVKPEAAAKPQSVVKPEAVGKPVTAPQPKVVSPAVKQHQQSPPSKPATKATSAARKSTSSSGKNEVAAGPSLVVKNAADVMLEMGTLPVGDGITRARRRRRTGSPSWRSAAILGTLAGAIASGFFLVYFVLRNNAGSFSLEQLWQSITAVPQAPTDTDQPFVPPPGKSAPPPSSPQAPGSAP